MSKYFAKEILSVPSSFMRKGSPVEKEAANITLSTFVDKAIWLGLSDVLVIREKAKYFENT